MHKVSRRGFLAALTGSALAVASSRLNFLRAANSPSAAVFSSTPAKSISGGVPVDFPPDTHWGHITLDQPQQTALANIYSAQFSALPSIDPGTWRLQIDGLVENPLVLDLETLRAFPAVEEPRVLECVNNPAGGQLIANMLWRGARLGDVLVQVKPHAEATHVIIEAADGYSTSLTRRWAERSDAMLAYALNGEPLDAMHGFPLRLHIPGLYGYKLPRWITRLSFVDYDYLGFWESHGWSAEGEMRTKAIILTPTDHAAVQAGTSIAIQGVAVAGIRKITAVEVQIDGGDWMPATLLPGKTASAWTQWYFRWTISAPGGYRVAARATDELGFTQSSTSGEAFPRGSDAIHAITILARA